MPTLAEAGAPGQESEVIAGVLLPGATPRDIVARLTRETAKIIAMPEVHERFATLGFEPIGSTPEEFGERIKAEIAKWAKVVRAANIQPQ
jgi:tripartite-type tricarboxylate transporter receptor subunit TctC